MREEEARAQEKADAAKAIKDECEADLAEVWTMLFSTPMGRAFMVL